VDRNILLGLLFFSWGLTCYHVIRAYLASPGASAFRALWNNRYSEEGKRHLRLHLFWLAVSAVLVSLLLAGKT
jgi:hypothetical protein